MNPIKVEREKDVFHSLCRYCQILKILQAPLTTQAKELKKRAEKAYRYGWIDDALKDFLESEKKNRYDFTIHQSLGNIYLFHKKNPDKALEYYEKAVKYATPYSPYYASFALLNIGLVRKLKGNLKVAFKATSKAIKLTPNFYEAHYQHSRYCAMIGKNDEAIKHLKKAIIEGDRYYCIKADSDDCFDSMRGKLQSFFKKFLGQIHHLSKRGIENTQEQINRTESYSAPSEEIDTAKRILTKANALLKRKNIFDCWDSIYKARVAEIIVTDYSVKYLSRKISRMEDDYSDNMTSFRKKAEFRTNIIFWIIFILNTFLPIIPILFGAITFYITHNVWLTTGAGLITGVIVLYFLFSNAQALENYFFDKYSKKYKDSYETRLSQIKDHRSKAKLRDN